MNKKFALGLVISFVLLGLSFSSSSFAEGQCPGPGWTHIGGPASRYWVKYENGVAVASTFASEACSEL